MAKSVRKSKKEDKKNILHEGTSEGIEELVELYDKEENVIVDEAEGEVIKGITLFDHFNNLTINKTPWENLSDPDRKSFANYMVILWLGMHPDLIQFMDEIQSVSIMQLSPKNLYKVLYDFLPKQKYYLKFIKGDKEGKYNPQLVELIANHYHVSKKNAIEYLNIYYSSVKGQICLSDLIKLYGKTEKELIKLTEIK